MADCTIDVTWVKKPTYGDVKKLYECFEHAVTQMGYEKISLHFNFQCGAMRYSAKSIGDFRDIAYGDINFSLTALQFLANSTDKSSVRINYLCGLKISATSKALLETFKETLNLEMNFETAQAMKQERDTNRAETHMIDSMSSTQTSISSPITINGSGNVINVAGGSINGNQIESEQNLKDSKENSSSIKGFISGVLQGVAGNAVWYILGLIGAAILGYFAIN